MKKLLKASGTLSLSLILCFTMLFADVGIASAETKIITGTFGEYYTYSLDTATGVVTFDMKTEKNNPILDWWDTELSNYNRAVKKIVFSESVKTSDTYPLEGWLQWGLFCAEEFQVSDNNIDYASQNGVLFNKDKSILLAYPIERSEAQYSIPNSVIQIGSDKKWNEEGRSCPFDSIENLKTIIIPSTVTKIMYNSFSNQGRAGGNSIKEFIVDESNLNYKSVDGVLFSKDGTELIAYPTGNARKEYIVPNTVKTIGADAFKYATQLCDITISNGVENIGKEAFLDYGGNAKNISIPASVTKIEDGTLSGNSYTINISRDTKLTKFPENAFGWNATADVYIPCDSNWTLNESMKERVILYPTHSLTKWIVTEYPNADGVGKVARMCQNCSYCETENFIDEDKGYDWGISQASQNTEIIVPYNISNSTDIISNIKEDSLNSAANTLSVYSENGKRTNVSNKQIITGTFGEYYTYSLIQQAEC